MAATFLATAALAVSMLPVPTLPVPTPEPTPEPGEQQQISGHTSARDGILRRGCRTYAWSYSVSTPDDSWTLETSIRDSRGKSVAAGVLFGSSHPRSGERRYDLCRRATRAGVFTITGTLTHHGGDEPRDVELPQSTFRLRLRR